MNISKWPNNWTNLVFSLEIAFWNLISQKEWHIQIKAEIKGTLIQHHMEMETYSITSKNRICNFFKMYTFIFSSIKMIINIIRIVLLSFRNECILQLSYFMKLSLKSIFKFMCTLLCSFVMALYESYLMYFFFSNIYGISCRIQEKLLNPYRSVWYILIRNKIF